MNVFGLMHFSNSIQPLASICFCEIWKWINWLCVKSIMKSFYCLHYFFFGWGGVWWTKFLFKECAVLAHNDNATVPQARITTSRQSAYTKQSVAVDIHVCLDSYSTRSDWWRAWSHGTATTTWSCWCGEYWALQRLCITSLIIDFLEKLKTWVQA